MVEKRKKVRFNWIDALIVIFILAVIAAAAYFLVDSFNPKENQGAEDFKVEIRIENVKKESLESLESLSLLQPETVVKDAVTGEEIGKIFSVRTEKSRYYGGLVEGENGYILGTVESDDEYDVYITVSADAEQDARGIYTVNGIRMLIGESVHFKIKSFAATAYIVKTEVSIETQA